MIFFFFPCGFLVAVRSWFFFLFFDSELLMFYLLYISNLLSRRWRWCNSVLVLVVKMEESEISVGFVLWPDLGLFVEWKVWYRDFSFKIFCSFFGCKTGWCLTAAIYSESEKLNPFCWMGDLMGSLSKRHSYTIFFSRGTELDSIVELWFIGIFWIQYYQSVIDDLTPCFVSFQLLSCSCVLGKNY